MPQLQMPGSMSAAKSHFKLKKYPYSTAERRREGEKATVAASPFPS